MLQILDGVVDDRHAVFAEQAHERGPWQCGDLRRSADTQAPEPHLFDRPQAAKRHPQLRHVLTREVWRHLDRDRYRSVLAPSYRQSEVRQGLRDDPLSRAAPSNRDRAVGGYGPPDGTPSKTTARDLRSEAAVVQWGARRHGSDGIHGNAGIVESVTYRIYRVLAGDVGSQRAIAPRFGP